MKTKEYIKKNIIPVVLLLAIIISPKPVFASSDGITYTFIGGIVDPENNFHDRSFDMGFILGINAFLSSEALDRLSYGFEFSYAMMNGKESVSSRYGRYEAENDFSALCLVPTIRYAAIFQK